MMLLKLNMEESKRRHIVEQMKNNVELKVRAELVKMSREIAKNKMSGTKFGENMALQKCSYVLGILETLYMMDKIDYYTREWGYDYFTNVLVCEEMEKRMAE